MSELELEANYRSIDRTKLNIELMHQSMSTSVLTPFQELECNRCLELLYQEMASREKILDIHLTHINITETINAFEPKIFTL